MYEQTRADRLITIGIRAPVRAQLLPVVELINKDDPDARQHCLLARAADQYPGVAGLERRFSEELTQHALVVEVAGGVRVRLGRADELQPVIVPTLADVVEVWERLAAGAVDRPLDWVDLGYRLGCSQSATCWEL